MIEGFISMCGVVALSEQAKVRGSYNHTTVIYVLCAATRYVTDIRIIRSEYPSQIKRYNALN